MAKIDEMMDTAEQMEEKLESKRETLLKKAECVTVKLSKPYEHTGVTYSEIKMDFSSLTGVQFEAIDDELIATGAIIVSPQASRRYQKLLAAKAAGIPSDVIETLNARDYLAVVNAAKLFLQLTA